MNSLIPLAFIGTGIGPLLAGIWLIARIRRTES